MSWQVDDIRDRFTKFLDPNQDDDPDQKYDTDGDGTDENERPPVSPAEWGAIWHYLDRAIYEVVNPQVGSLDATIYPSSTTTTSTSAPLPVDKWSVQDAPYTNPTSGEVAVDRDGQFAVSGSVELTADSNGTAQASIAFQRSTDGGGSWSDIPTTTLRAAEVASSVPIAVTAAPYVLELNTDDRIRLLVRYEGGSGNEVELTGGWVTLSLVD